MNSVSPRFFTEVIGKTTPGGRFLSLDSSVFVLFTANDPTLPHELIYDPDGRERFRKLPADRTRDDQLRRRLSVPLRDRSAMLGVAVRDAQRLGCAEPERHS